MPPRKQTAATDPSETIPTITPMLDIQTHAQNKNVHPGVAAGVVKAAPIKQCSPQEMQEACKKEQWQQEEEEQQQKAAVQKVASIEDQMHEEDEQRCQISCPPENKRTTSVKSSDNPLIWMPTNANHDESNLPSMTEHIEDTNMQACVAAKMLPGIGYRKDLIEEDNDMADNAKDNNYEDDCDSEDENEDDGNGKGEGNIEHGKGKKSTKAKLGRADITTAHETVPTKGTPVVNPKRKPHIIIADSEATKSMKKLKLTAPFGLQPQWKATNQYFSSAASAASSSTPNNDSESDFQYGGILDNDKDNEIKHPAHKTNEAVGAKTTVTLPPMIKIKAEPSTTVITKKAQCGGTGKWTLRHLPPGTNVAFSQQVVPLARKNAGSQKGDPWQPLSAEDIQSIIDTVYGLGKHTVDEDEAWCGLVTYRLNNWRNGFSTTAAEIIKQYFTGNPEHFPDTDTIKDTITYMLTTNEKYKTKPFHWKEWDEDENEAVKKKGPFQSLLVLSMLALAHYQEINKYPAMADERLIRAYILAIQAVEHALGAWESGVFVEWEGLAVHFSGAKYSNVLECDTSTNLKGRPTTKLNKQAMQYIPTMNSFKDTTWQDIFSTVSGYIDQQKLKKKKKAKGLESDSSMEIVMAEEDYVLVSDDE